MRKTVTTAVFSAALLGLGSLSAYGSPTGASLTTVKTYATGKVQNRSPLIDSETRSFRWETPSASERTPAQRARS